MARWANENRYNGEVAVAATTTGVPSALIKAVIGIESGFEPDALNTSDPGFAWGLMQMIPATAKGLGYTGAMQALLGNPQLAITLGAKLLAQNLGRTGGVVADSVSAYNGGFRPAQGFGAKRANGTYQNQAYVDKVLGAYRYFGGSESAVAGSSGFFRPDPATGGDRVGGDRPTWRTRVGWVLCKVGLHAWWYVLGRWECERCGKVREGVRP